MHYQIARIGCNGLLVKVLNRLGQIIAVFIVFEQHIFSKRIARKRQHLHGAVARHLVAFTLLQAGDGGIELLFVGQGGCVIVLVAQGGDAVFTLLL